MDCSKKIGKIYNLFFTKLGYWLLFKHVEKHVRPIAIVTKSPSFSIFYNFFLGAFSGVVTPVPISNTEVKDSSGDDTAYLTAGK